MIKLRLCLTIWLSMFVNLVIVGLQIFYLFCLGELILIVYCRHYGYQECVYGLPAHRMAAIVVCWWKLANQLDRHRKATRWGPCRSLLQGDHTENLGSEDLVISERNILLCLQIIVETKLQSTQPLVCNMRYYCFYCDYYLLQSWYVGIYKIQWNLR